MPKLKEVSIEITNKCNLKCIHCSSNAGNPFNNELSLTEIKDIIEQSRALGTAILTLSGGEPLLHPNIGEIIQYAKPLEVRLQTSGNETMDKILQAFPKTGKIVYSIHGLESTHETITGIAGSYRRAIENIRKTKEHGITAEVHIVANRLNYRQIPALEQTLQIPIHLLRLVEQGRCQTNLQLNKNQFRELQEMLLSHPNILLGHNIDRRHLSDSSYEPLQCQLGKDKILIRANGDIAYCAAMKHTRIGNIRDDSLDYFWNSHPFITMVREFLSSGFRQMKGKCSKCDALNECRGGCIAQRLQKYNDLHRGPDPLCYRKQQ